MDQQGCKPDMWPCFLILVSFTAQFIQFGIVWTVGLFNVFFLEAFHGDIGKTSLICSLHTSFFYAAGPVSGILVNRFGYRVTCITGSIIATIGMISSAFASYMFVLYFTFGILAGFGLGLTYVPCLSIIALCFPRHQTLAFAVATSGVGLGVMVFPFIIEYFEKIYGWRGATLLTGGITLQFCILGAFLKIPNKPKHFNSPPKDLGNTETRSTRSAIQLTVFKNIAYLSFCVHNLLFWFGHSVVSVHLPTYAHSQNLNHQKIGLLVSITGLTGVLGRLPVGLITLCKSASPIRVYSLGLCLCCLVTTLIPLATSYYGLAVYAGLFGFLLGMICGCVASVVVDILDVSLLPSGYGYMLLFDAAGSLLGAPAAGFLYDVTKRYDISFYLSGAAMLLSIIFMILPVWRVETHQKEKELPIVEKLPLDDINGKLV